MKFIPTIFIAVAVFGSSTNVFAKPSLAKKSGTYTFKSSSGKPYIGKSVDTDKRMKQHEKSGKLNKNDKGTVEVETNNLGKQGNRTVEKTRIRSADIVTNGGLANKQHAPFSRKNNK